MASKELIEVIDAAALECPLCMNHFTSPKILACVHSFCLECLEKWMKKSNGVLSCPTCREVCQIPEGGLQNLKNNIFISGLLDYVTTLEQKTAPTCSLCSTATCFFCRDCDEQYCTSCRDIHAKMKISQHHRIITMEEYTVINPVEHLASKSVYCCNHNMPLHFFCGSCKVPVCVGCTLVEHPISDGHNIINIETAFKSFAKLSESFINKAEENLIKFHDIAKQLKIKEELEMSNYKECEVKITEEADKAHQLIDRYKKDQLQDLKSSHQHNLKLISANESEVELAIAKFSSTQGIARTLIHSPNHAMALRSSSDVSERMDELVEQYNISDDIFTPNLVKYKINTDQTIIVNAADFRIDHADAPNLTNPQPVQFIPGYLPGIPIPGLAEQQYIPSMMSSTPGPHYQGEEAYEAEGDAYNIDPHVSLKLRDNNVFSTPARNIAQSRTPEASISSESTRIDEGFAGFSGFNQLNPFLQQNPSTGMPQVAPNGSAGMKPSIYQPKLNIPQPASSPVAMSKDETAPERSASDAPLLRKILIGSDVDPPPAVTQFFPAFSSVSSNSRFGGGDKLSEKSAVSPNFTFGTRLESAKAKEAEHTPVFTPSASFGSKSDASGNPQTVTSGFSFGGGNIFTPVSTNPASTIQFSQSSSIFNQPFSQLNSNSTKEPTTTSTFAGLSLGAQTPPTAAPQPRKPTERSLFSGL